MLQYQSSLSFESETFPGVTFTLRKMSEGRRAQLRLATAESNARIRNYVRESQRISAQPADSRDICRVAELNELIETEVISKLNPAWVRWGLKDITGITVDGNDHPDADLLITEGPSDLTGEILLAIKTTSQMSEEELKNFVLPSTSGALTDGSVKTISVTTVSAGESTEAGIADTSRS